MGFHRAGFRNVIAVEENEDALNSHILNFSALATPDAYAAFPDVRAIAPADAVKHLTSRNTPATDTIDVLIGGPPCQAFSLLGRAALWGIAERKHAHAADPRATLYERFLVFVEQLQPLAFLMENVPEIGKFDGGNLAEDIALAATALGYTTRYTLLNSAWYGVPQFRERMFILGIRQELGVIPTFPSATYACAVPRGYATSRAGISKAPPVLPPMEHFVDFPPFDDVNSSGRARTPSAGDALCDLPTLRYHLNGSNRHNGQLEEFISYGRRSSQFTREMRSWPDFESGNHSDGHAIRFTPRDYALFAKMAPGNMYPDAVAIAERIFHRRLARLQRQSRQRIGVRSRLWQELRSAIVPPYDINRYPNKYRKMSANEPAHTVPAHLGKDCYSHIHYDSSQARSISVREAARLQSFPDGFVICGSMNARFTQIGNAVPPLMAFAIASKLKEQLRNAVRKTGRGC